MSVSSRQTQRIIIPDNLVFVTRIRNTQDCGKCYYIDQCKKVYPHRNYDLDSDQICPKKENEVAGKVDDMANWGKVAMKALPSLPQNWANSHPPSNWPHSLWGQCLLQIGAILIFGSTLSFPLAHAATPIANYSTLSAWERLRDKQLTPVQTALCHYNAILESAAL